MAISNYSVAKILLVSINSFNVSSATHMQFTQMPQPLVHIEYWHWQKHDRMLSLLTVFPQLLHVFVKIQCHRCRSTNNVLPVMGKSLRRQASG